MAVQIQTFVLFDLETTGLPHQERNMTKIIELCMLAVSREDILNPDINSPPTTVLSVLLNPAPKKMHPFVIKLTGIDEKQLVCHPKFSDEFGAMENFLKVLPKPLCFVAHNGNLFDYKIFNAEMNDAKLQLSEDVLCVDSRRAFRELDKSNLLSDHQERVDELVEKVAKIATTDSPNKKETSAKVKPERKLYSLSVLHKRLTRTDYKQTHRAEDDCKMLLSCIMSTKKPFVRWADRNAKPLTSIPALVRYKAREPKIE